MDATGCHVSTRGITRTLSWKKSTPLLWRLNGTDDLHIAFTIYKFPPESLGGTEIYAWSLAALTQRGHEVHIFYALEGIPNPSAGSSAMGCNSGGRRSPRRGRLRPRAAVLAYVS